MSTSVCNFYVLFSSSDFTWKYCQEFFFNEIFTEKENPD